MALSTAQQIQQLYIGYLGRAAEQPGLDYWISMVGQGRITLDGIRTNFVNEQPEYAAMYGGLTRAQTVSRIYNNLFERDFDPEGFDYWVSGGGAAVPPDNLIAAFLAAAGPGDSEVLSRKLDVAMSFTLTAGGDHYDVSSGSAIIADVKDAASHESAMTLIYTANAFLQSNSVGDAKLVGALQARPGVAEEVRITGRPGEMDIYLVNTDNFDRRGDKIIFTDFDMELDQLFLGRQYDSRAVAPSQGRTDRLELFLEQVGADVRMSIETSMAGARSSGGADLVTITIVGARVDEIIPVELLA